MRALFSMITVAACLLAAAVVSWNVVRTPYGHVHLAINPEVEISVNRWDYVVDIKGENPDGEKLIAGYDHGYTKIDRVADDLADRAAKMGFLKADGAIRVSVDSSDAAWKADTERRIVIELKQHTGGKYCVTNNDEECRIEVEIPIETPEPVPAPTPSQSETQPVPVVPNDDDDDWDDDDDDYFGGADGDEWDDDDDSGNDDDSGDGDDWAEDDDD